MTSHTGNGNTPDDPAASLDPLGLGKAWAKAMESAATNPAMLMEAATRYATGIAAAVSAAGARAMGAHDTAGPVEAPAKDRRFADAAWKENPAYFLLLQGYLLWSRLVSDVVAAADLDATEAEKAAFTGEVIVDALAPTNFLMTNPVAQKRMLETGGLSLVRGAQMFLDDLTNHGGLPRQVTPDAFTVGTDLAATPGQVVYRNDLMELIQYAPTTKTVHTTPLLLSPPWINKYYIMDLAPGRSFAQWAVDHGHTVFAISYKNPGSEDRAVSMEDYLHKGPLEALDVIQTITGSKQANIVGLCLGGTLTGMMLAYLADRGEDRIRSATFLNTLVDFSRPGRLGAFTDEPAIAYLEGQMAERGYLESSEMMNTFTFMRANDLVWNYAVNNWLMGEEPPAFDILAWNSDGTRMPAAMHSFFIRSCYLNNTFAQGTMELDGVRLDPGAVDGDFYVLAAQEDHITPWKGSYLTTQVFPRARSRFVLSASGHIAGIVNPPNPKAWYRTGPDVVPANPDEWIDVSTRHEGSWWEDWAKWIAKRGGRRVPPPAMGGDAYEPIGDAPGTYVLGK